MGGVCCFMCVLCEFKNFKRREKYIISNNFEINGENLGALDQKITKEKSILFLNVSE